jgi:hypothetical protein
MHNFYYKWIQSYLSYGTSFVKYTKWPCEEEKPKPGTHHHCWEHNTCHMPHGEPQVVAHEPSQKQRKHVLHHVSSTESTKRRRNLPVGGGKYWISIGLKIRLHKHIDIHKGIWSEMISCFSCFIFYCFSSFHWFIQTIWDTSYPSSDYHYNLNLTLFFLMPLPFYSYWPWAIQCSTFYRKEKGWPGVTPKLSPKTLCPLSFVPLWDSSSWSFFPSSLIPSCCNLLLKPPVNIVGALGKNLTQE